MKTPRTKLDTRFLAWSLSCLVALHGYSQNPSSCASVGQRANSNGNANSCPNVNSTPYALNFLGTSYATVPTSAKTGNLQLNYSGLLSGLLPYAITRVWLTTSGTTIQSVSFGPASTPVLSGGNTQVNYCFYGTNLPTAGTLSLELTNPLTGTVWGICSYDASCNSNCVVVTTPVALPVKLETFTAKVQSDGTVLVNWITAQEQGNKGFAVERSAGDSSFQEIAFLNSPNKGGTSATSTPYQYTDSPSGLTHVLYRLRQQDLDGRYVYSQVLAVDLPAESTTPRIYSIGSQLFIDASRAVASHTGQVVVYDTQGRIIKRAQLSGANPMIINGLPEHSVYYVRLLTTGDGQPYMKAVYIN